MSDEMFLFCHSFSNQCIVHTDYFYMNFKSHIDLSALRIVILAKRHHKFIYRETHRIILINMWQN